MTDSLDALLAEHPALPDDCIETTSVYRVKGGYGHVWWQGKKWLAHRRAWVEAHGPIPDGLLVLHRCDNPPCVNPAHLFLGTQQENMADKVSKGRGRSGETAVNHLLTWLQVEEMRRTYTGAFGEQARLAQVHGVHPSVVSRIVRGERWQS